MPEKTLACPCCKISSLTSKSAWDLHMKIMHPSYNLAPKQTLGRRYQRIVSHIEKCLIHYRQKNIEVVSQSEIANWLKDNTKGGMARKRVSSLLQRRPQFVLHKKARRVNSNQIESWWSLGDVDATADFRGYEKWIDVETKLPLVPKK
jgi:hypothetical protein|tara:strand:- start:38 stop:481 length:444 start_codon:yes stop_codon:yes gene_type:complete